MSESLPRVAIIGGGPAGLSSAKHALDHGLIPIIFERRDEIAGLWGFGDGSATWNSMCGTNCRFTQGFDEFPMTKEWANVNGVHIRKEKMNEYYHAYIKEFNLAPHIRFRCDVKALTAAPGDKWKVTYISDIGGEEKREIFDFAIVATGMFTDLNIPKFKDVDKFKGKVFHSSLYSRFKSDLKDKTVIVIGQAFSGSEICEELVDISRSVTNIFPRHKRWFIQRNIRLNDKETTIMDVLFFTRAARREGFKKGIIERNLEANKLLNDILVEQQQIPVLKVDIDNPTFNVAMGDDYVRLVGEGKIKAVNSEVRQFTESGVMTNDGIVYEADVVILATGYRCEFPFLDEDFLRTIEYDPNNRNIQAEMILDRVTWPPKYQNIAFVGYVHSFHGLALLPLIARWVAMVFGGKLRHPSEEEIRRGRERERVYFELSKTYLLQITHSHGELLGDEIAEAIGILPDFKKLKEEDPELFKKLWFGPWMPYHYRLQGPGANREVALQQINEAWELVPDSLKAHYEEQMKSLSID